MTKMRNSSVFVMAACFAIVAYVIRMLSDCGLVSFRTLRSMDFKPIAERRAPSDRLNIGIVGAGAGGLTAALELQQRGHSVTVYEAHEELKSGIGANLYLSSGAVVLARLGLGPALKDSLTPLDNLELLKDGGEHLAGMPLGALLHQRTLAPELAEDSERERKRGRRGEGEEKLSAQPLGHVLRDHFLLLLANHLQPGTLKLGHRLTAFSQNADLTNVTLSFSNGLVATHDLLIAADGIRSRVRQQLFGGDGPQSTGLALWLALASDAPSLSVGQQLQVFSQGGPSLPPSTSSLFWAGPPNARKVVLARTYAETEGAGAREGAGATEGGEWSLTSNKTLLLEQLRLHQDGLPQAFMEAGESMERLVHLRLFFSATLPDAWHHGRVVLLGDAAHAVPAFYFAGANLAIQDAACLARSLEAFSDPALALQEYHRIRQTPSEEVLKLSRFLGSLQARGGWAGTLRDWGVRVLYGSGLFASTLLSDVQPIV